MKFDHQTLQRFVQPLSELCFIANQYHLEKESPNLFQELSKGRFGDISFTIKTVDNGPKVVLQFFKFNFLDISKSVNLNNLDSLLYALNLRAELYKNLPLSIDERTKISGLMGDAVDSVDRSFIYRFIVFLYGESTKLNPSYIQHFWFNSSRKKLEVKQEGNDFSFEFDSSFFMECICYFLLREAPTNVIWYKQVGAFKFYKHHYLKFGRYFKIENSAETGLQWIFEEDNSAGHDIIETSLKSGIPAHEVFHRAVARYVNSDGNDYLTLRNNCEHFGTFCFYGSPRSRQVRYILFAVFIIFIIHKESAYVFIFMAFLAEFHIYQKFSPTILNPITQYIKSFIKFPR